MQDVFGTNRCTDSPTKFVNEKVNNFLITKSKSNGRVAQYEPMNNQKAPQPAPINEVPAERKHRKQPIRNESIFQEKKRDRISLFGLIWRIIGWFFGLLTKIFAPSHSAPPPETTRKRIRRGTKTQKAKVNASNQETILESLGSPRRHPRLDFTPIIKRPNIPL